MLEIKIRVSPRAGEPEPGVFGSLEPEPEPLEKKPGAGAGAAWNKSQEPEPEPEPLKIWPAPQPCEKIKSIRKLYFSYSFLGKISSFIVKKDNYFTCFIFFCSFTLLVCGEKTILPRSRVFLAPWSRSRLKKKHLEPEPDSLRKKIRSRSRSRLKKSQEPEPLKNLPAPQPWFHHYLVYGIRLILFYKGFLRYYKCYKIGIYVSS